MEVSTPLGNAHDSSRIIPNMHVSLHKVFSLIIHEGPIKTTSFELSFNLYQVLNLIFQTFHRFKIQASIDVMDVSDHAL